MSDPELASPALRPGRRGFLGTAAASAAGVAMAAAVGGTKSAQAATTIDYEVLNFALNLEYLEAEYYSYAMTGKGLPKADTKTGKGMYGGVVSVPKTPKVTFTSGVIQDFAMELMQDEVAHVKFLRAALGNAAYAEPQIDIGSAFDTLAQAAGLGSSFDPFESEVNFLLGSFIFEDVGVTAYHGGAGLLTNPAYLSAAAAILGTEAYHAGGTRTMLINLARSNQSAGILNSANLISNLRDKLDGKSDDDQGLNYQGANNIVPVDMNGLTFSRTTFEVLSIVYGNTTPNNVKGLFFPKGMNGKIN